MIEMQTIWGWQPALYLFLGGLGAGTFVVAALVQLITHSHKKIVPIAMWSAVVFLGVGLALLLTELSAPLRALMMWQSFSHLTSSWMAIGAWLLFGAIIVCCIAALANTEYLYRFIHLSSEKAETIAKVAAPIGAVLSLCVAIYTGILLMMAPGVPFWNTTLLPLLFTVSALDTGVAFFALLLAVFESGHQKLGRVLEIGTICLVVCEALVLTLFLVFMLNGGTPFYETLEIGYGATTSASANSFISGQLAIPFWLLLVVIGLAVPFVLAVVQVVSRPKRAKVVAITASVCVLIGGCTLRFIMLLAGTHVDIVANAIAALL